MSVSIKNEKGLQCYNLQKTVTNTTGGATKITNYKYAGAFVYKNDTLELVNHGEGRLRAPMQLFMIDVLTKQVSKGRFKAN